MDKDDIINLLGIFLIYILAPVILGILSWFILSPETFWQRFTVLGFVTIVYFLILLIETLKAQE